MATGRTYAGQTAEERQAKRRAAFMEAGLELYGTKSYAAVTVPEIVEQAGQTRRAFYECFADREDLLRAVDQELVREQLIARTRVAEVPSAGAFTRSASGFFDDTTERTRDRVARSRRWRLQHSIALT